MRKISTTTRKAMLDDYDAGMSCAEIARKYDRSLSTVYKLIQRIKNGVSYEKFGRSAKTEQQFCEEWEAVTAQILRCFQVHEKR